MSSDDAPIDLDIEGDLDDEAIEALAELLVSLAEDQSQ